MRQRLHRIALPAAGINITSLLDITFVLLISFMVVAPAVKYSIDLELPKVSESKQLDKKKPVSVQITNKENRGVTTYYVDGQATPLDDVGEKIIGNEGYQKDRMVALEADKDVPWQDVAALMNELKNHRIENIGIVTEKGKR